MSLDSALLLMTRLLGITMLLQGIELFSLTRRPEFFEIWSTRNLNHDLRKGLPFSGFFIWLFFTEEAFRGVILFQILAALSCLWFPSALVLGLLFGAHFIVCVRFRGTFNGGSDMMLFVLLSGLFFSFLSTNPAVQKWGLIYIAIHAGYSYLKAGLAKIIRHEWRTGAALPAFLERSLFPAIRDLGSWARGQKALSLVLCWFVLIFELSFAILPFAGSWLFVYFSVAIFFHLMIFFCFGLNRFFWTWLSAWPAIFYSMSLLRGH